MRGFTVLDFWALTQSPLVSTPRTTYRPAVICRRSSNWTPTSRRRSRSYWRSLPCWDKASWTTQRTRRTVWLKTWSLPGHIFTLPAILNCPLMPRDGDKAHHLVSTSCYFPLACFMFNLDVFVITWWWGAVVCTMQTIKCENLNNW